MLLTAEYLRNYMNYDPETGEFSYKSRQGTRSARAICGKTLHGYRKISIKRQHYPAHRLAWLYVYGEFPNGYIDHINLDKTDNRIANLRVATPAQNNANTRHRGLSGFKGVTWHKQCKRWQAAIKVNGKNHHLGLFDSAEAAHTVYCRAAEKHYGEFARAA